MNAGLIFGPEDVTLQVGVSGSGSRGGSMSGNLEWQAQLVSEYADTAGSTEVSTEMVVHVRDLGGGGSTVWSFRLPLMGINETRSTSVISASAEQTVIVSGYRLYCTGSQWMVVWDGVEWYIDGALEQSWGEGSADGPIGYLVPASVPFLGVPPELSASAVAGLLVDPPSTIGPTGSLNATSTATGGWKIGDDELPVTCRVLAVDGECGECDASIGEGDIAIASTWDQSVTASAGQSNGRTFIERFTCNCTVGTTIRPAIIDRYKNEYAYALLTSKVRLVPDLEKSLRRWHPDIYGAVIERWAIPKAEAFGTTDCNGIITGTAEEWIPEYLHDIRRVDGDPHEIEGPFGETTLAPYHIIRAAGQAATYEDVVIDPGACTAELGQDPQDPSIGCGGDLPPDEICQVTAQSSFPHISGSVGVRAYLNHDLDRARYINFHACPHWHFNYWFPKDDDAGDHWQVYGDDAPASEYWLPIRQQHQTHPDMPSEEKTRRRNSLISAPLLEGSLANVMATFFTGTIVAPGPKSSWWGISRFKPQLVDPENSVALTSASAPDWSPVGGTCTLAHGSRITATPLGGADTIRFRYDLGTWAREPYQYPHIADRITIGWQDPNVVSVSAYLVSISGKRMLLGTTKATLDRPTGQSDIKYAGSWGQDFGNDYLPDTGVDSRPNGISAGHLTSSELAQSFAFVSGQGAAYLEFEIECTGAVEVDYPVFLASPDPQVYHEQGHHSALLWTDGPGHRFGQHAWYDRDLGVVKSEPLVLPPGHLLDGTDKLRWKASVLDWLAFKRTSLMGKAATEDLTDEIEALYDEIEGQTPGHTDVGTIAFVAQAPEGTNAYGVLVSSLAEVPPLAVWPTRARDPETLAQTGDYAQEAWCLAQEPMRYIHAQTEMHLHPPSASAITSAMTGLPSGWTGTEHRAATDNDEGPAYEVKVSGKVFAWASPWHGYFAELSGGGPADIHLARDPHSSLAYAVMKTSAGIDLWRFHMGGMSDVLPVIESTSVGSAQVAWAPDQRIVVAYEDDGTSYAIESRSIGDVWGEPVAIGDGTTPAPAVDPKASIEFCAIHDGSAWRLHRKLQDDAWEDVAEIVPADEVKHAGLEVLGDAGNLLIFTVEIEGAIRRFVSQSLGEFWAEV